MRSLFIVVLHAETVQPSLHLLPSTSSFICVFQEDAGCMGSICLLQQLDACPDGRMFSLSSVSKPLFHATVKLLVQSALFTVMS